MMTQIAYASSSAVWCEGERTTVGLTANERRPVRLHARIVRDALYVRLALSTLCEVMFGARGRRGERLDERRMDPVVTVHSDRVTFEAFSGDGSAYGRVSIDSRAFEPEGELVLGTSSVDISRWFWQSLSALRSTCETWIQIDSGGTAEGERQGPRADRRVDLSGDWTRRLWEMQAAASCSSLHLVVRPVDALSLLGELVHVGAGAGVLRFSLEPGGDASVMLEPSETVIRLRGASPDVVDQREVRSWGRRWLRVLEPVLAHADDLHLFLRRSGWPSFYVVQLPSVLITVGVQGDDAWSHGVRGDMVQLAPPVPPEFLSPVLAALVSERVLSLEEAIAQSGLEPQRAMGALTRLCRAGRAFYELDTGRFRHREMFERPIDIASLEAMDPRAMAATAFMADGAVNVRAVERCEWRGRARSSSRTRLAGAWDLAVGGVVGEGVETRVVIGDGGQIVFGSCCCQHFRQWRMHRGPCEHMLALLLASEKHRLDGEPEGAGSAPSDPV